MTYLYVQSEEQLWTVGTGEPGTNSWRPESDHGSDDDAARRVAWLNGSPSAGPLSDGERQQVRALLFSLSLTVGQVDEAVDAIASILGRGTKP